MRPYADHIAKQNGRQPLEMANEGIHAPGLPHQSHTGGGADGEQAAPHPRGQGHQQPLPGRHLRLHRQHGEHHRNVVDDGGEQAYDHIGLGRIPLIEELGRQRQIPHEAEPADAHHHPVEEEQGVPLGLGNLVEHIERHYGAEAQQPRLVTGALIEGALPRQDARLGLAQVEAEKLQIAQPRHHAEHRGQLQEVMAGDGRPYGEEEEQHYGGGPAPERHLLVQHPGGMARHHQAHQEGRDQEVEQAGDEEREELAEGHLARLPHHQGGDVAEGAEGAAGIGRHHYVDAGQVDEAAILVGHIEHHCAHQERSGEVVHHGGDEESQEPGEPEQGAQAEPGPHQAGAQGGNSSLSSMALM